METSLFLLLRGNNSDTQTATAGSGTVAGLTGKRCLHHKPNKLSGSPVVHRREESSHQHVILWSHMCAVGVRAHLHE